MYSIIETNDFQENLVRLMTKIVMLEVYYIEVFSIHCIHSVLCLNICEMRHIRQELTFEV